VPQIEVTFDIDANGIVNVSAKDLATGKEQKITITASTNLSGDEVDALVNEAERHADDDRRALEEAELRNNADSLSYQTERLLQESGETLPPADKEAAEKAIADVREALQEGDTGKLRGALEVLQTASQKIGEQMYAAQQQAAADGSTDGAAPAEQPADDDEVVDAEFKAADDK
jgi:molecular chaperone DnaK